MNPLYKSTFVLGLATLASRILGLLRDMVIAGLFGASIQAGVFFLVFRPFDLFRKLLAEGIMGISLVPILTEQIQKGENQQAASTVVSALFWVAVSGMLLIFAGCFALPMLIQLAAPKLFHNSQTLELGISLARMMLPYAMSMGFSCIFMAMLHSVNLFYVPAAGPVIFNAVIILCTIVFDQFTHMGILAVAAGVFLGGLVQVCIQLPWVLPKLVSWRPRLILLNPHITSALKGFLPCVTGSAAYQINILIAALFTSFLDLKSVGILYFADRLIQFPLALIGSTCATVLLPAISIASVKKREMQASQKPMTSLEKDKSFPHHFFFLCLVSVSAAAGLLAVRKPLVFLLFCHGFFGVQAASQTAECLAFLSIGLWAYIGSRIFASLYHGMGITRLPLYAALVSFGVNIVLGLVLWKIMGIKGIALSVSISAMTGCAILFFSSQNPWKFHAGQVFLSACRAVFISAIMFFFIHGAARHLMDMELSRTGAAAGLAACVIAGILFIAAGTLCLAGEDTLFLMNVIKIKKGRKPISHEHT